MPRQKAEIFLTGIAILSPRFPRTLPGTGFPFTAPLGQRALAQTLQGWHHPLVGLRQLEMLCQETAVEALDFSFCFEGHKSKRLIKRQLLSQVHFLYLVKRTLSLGLKLKTTKN